MNKILIICISIIFSLISLPILAQTDSCKSVLKLEVVGITGKISAHHKEMEPMCDRPFYAGELRIGMQTTGNQYWHQTLKYPYLGIGVYLSEFQKKEIGHPIALFGFMDIPMYRWQKSSLSTSWSCGLTFNINKYDSIKNPNNMAIGSEVNAYIEFSLRYKYQITNKIEIGCGASFQHFSNGATKQPNWGMNMLGINIIASYIPTKRDIHFQKSPEPEITKRYEWNIMYATGIRDNKTGVIYHNSTLSVALSRRISYKRTLGLGIDIFHNEYFKDEYAENEHVELKKLLSQAIFANSDLIAGKLRINIGLGVYTLRSKAYTLPIYERAGVRFYPIKQLFTNVSIKAHGAKAEFIECGLGVTL